MTYLSLESSIIKAFIESLEERFYQKVHREGEHLIWDGGTSEGRPQIRNVGKTLIGYTAGWLIKNGEVPEGHHIAHGCDVGLCVEPEHQELQADSAGGGKGGAAHRRRRS